MEYLRDYFLLDPGITFLNFGSFGACPKPVFAEYQRFQLELERNPVQFNTVKGYDYIRESREALASYINCNTNDVVYTPNPTFAINTVAKNLKLDTGDEVLSTDLEYGALDRTWDYYCKKSGARFVRQHIRLPLQSKEQFAEDFWKGFSFKTKAIFISQITSTTGLILPVSEICAEAKKRGLLTIVDGAHVPGHIPLDLAQLQADIYTGACHKWMLTPKGSSFLVVKKEFQPWMEPLVVSWGYKSAAPSDSQFLDYHQFNGTRDFSAYLTIPKAIEFMKEHSWWQVAEACRELVRSNVQRFCDLVGTSPLAPVTGEFFGQLASVPVRATDPVRLKNRLFNDYGIEVPVMPHNDQVYLRYSVNAFNSQKDLDKLYTALKELRTDGWV